MTTAPGWYPDPTEERTMRFWNGTQWQGERTLMVADAAPEPQLPAAEGSAPMAIRMPMTTTSWFLFGGAAVAALGSLLPWEQDTTPFGTHVTAGPTSVPGAAAMLLGLLAAVVWIAWPTRTGNLTKARRAGLTVVIAALTFFVFAKFAALGNAQSSANAGADQGTNLFGSGTTMTYGAGLGLYIYAAGNIALWIGAARAWRARRNQPA